MSVRTRLTAWAAATLLVAAAPAVVPSPAQAQVTGGVTDGTATWGLSTYLNSASFGRPTPLASAYVAPATFAADTRLSTWGAGTGLVAPDGSADLAFEGTSVNFAATSGAWLKLADLEADLDADGNGTVSAEVSYGQSTTGTPPAVTYDPQQPAVRGPARVDLVDLTGNSAADRALGEGTATWTGLDGAWSSELTTFLAGSPATETEPAVPAFIYAGQVSSSADRTPLPLTFTTATETPDVTASVTGASAGAGLTVAVAGTGFRAATNPGDAGVYVGIAEAGGLPDVSTPAGAANFAAFDYVMPPSIVDGAFTKTLTAPTENLDPAKTYAVYTWQAHTHSNTTQDTETPLVIDWSAFEPQESTTTLTGATSRPYGRTSTLTASVDGPGTVTLTGVGAAQQADVVDGAATFTVPASLRVGTYAAKVTYSGGGDVTGSQATRSLKVTKVTPKVATAWSPKATSAKAGALRVTVSGPAAVAAPSGKVTVRLTRDGAVRKLTGTLRAGVVKIKVPAPAKGRWKVVATYAGSPSFTSAKRSSSLVVR